MKKTLKLVVLLLAVLMALVGCSGGNSGNNTPADNTTPASSLVYDEGTVLRVAAGYNSANTAISFKDAEVTGEGLTLADGVTYHTNDLKPTWTYLENILKVKPKKLVYISCNPATLVRDLHILEDSYNIESIKPVDMFCWTSHVECVSVLELKESTEK